MMRGPTWLITDTSAIQGIVEAHPQATNILLAGQWITVASPIAEVLAQYDREPKGRQIGFTGETA